MYVVYLRDLDYVSQIYWILFQGFWHDDYDWHDDAVWED